MKIQLSDHFTYGRLLRFTFPAMVMMVFTSLYGVVDGLFVSNYVGKTALAAINFVFPASRNPVKRYTAISIKFNLRLRKAP